MINIVIADDDKAIRKGLASIIERSGLDCQIIAEAANGNDALTAINKYHPDVLITDIKMPVIDGVELVKQVAVLKQKPRMIVLSGFDEYTYVRETLKRGVVDYLLKPINKVTLIELLESITREIKFDLEKSTQLKKLNENVSVSRDMLRDKLMSNLIRSHNSDRSDFIEEFELAEFIPLSNFLLVMVGLDNLLTHDTGRSKEHPEMLTNFFRKQLQNDVERLSAQKQILVAQADEQILLLYTYSDDNDSSGVSGLSAIIEVLQNSFYKQSGYTFTAGVSEPFKRTSFTGKACEQALLAFEMRFINGTNKIIPYRTEYLTYSNVKENFFDNYIEQLLSLIDLTDAIRSRKHIEMMMDKLNAIKAPPKQFRELIKWLINRICVLQIEFACACDSAYILNCIDKLDTFPEMYNFVGETFFETIQQISKNRAVRSRRIIEQAKAYIAENYAKEINLKMVADHVFLNASYLSVLFKKETGINFIDFLLDMRIKEAKKLLAKPNAKVYEVAELVGYDDPTSFNRAFRKIIGVSPSEYRKLIK